MRVAAGAGPDLVEQPPEMRLLDLLEPARTILGRVAPWVRSGADQRAILLPLICREGLHCDDLIDDAGQLAADLGALDLRHPVLAAVIILALIKDRSEEHTSELQSRGHLVCRLLLEEKKGAHIVLEID